MTYIIPDGSLITEQEIKYIAEGCVRRRYIRIQTGAMLCIALFILIAWNFATANFIWFCIGMLVLWILIFEPLRRRDMKVELRRLYIKYGIYAEPEDPAELGKEGGSDADGI